MGRTEAHADNVASVALSPSAAARSSIAASWRRSMVSYGLDPANEHRLQQLDGSSFRQHKMQAGAFRHTAKAELDRLFQLTGSAGCGIFMTDHTGIVIDHRCKSSDEDAFHIIGLGPGAICNEETEGTNGMGTCLVEQRPVIVHQNEHFYTRSTAFTCIGVPIFGAQGEMLGVLDISSARAGQTRSANLLLADAVMQSARRIEAAYFRSCHPGTRIIVAETEYCEGSALLAVNGDDLVVGATRAARLAFNLGTDGPFDARPAADLLDQNGDALDMSAVQKSVILRALARTSGNISAAARQLGIGRTTLYRRMKHLRIQK